MGGICTYINDNGYKAKTKSNINLFTKNNKINEDRDQLDLDKSFVENAKQYYKKAVNAKQNMEIVEQQLQLATKAPRKSTVLRRIC